VKCTQCGVDISQFDVTCPACGAPQQQISAPSAPASQAAYDDALPPVRPVPPKVGSIGLWIALLVVLIAAGGVYEQTLKVVGQIQPADLSGDQSTRMAQFQASHDACDAMEVMVAQADQQMNATDFKDALGTAEEGLTHQDACTFDSKPAFAGILTSVKAISEHFLLRGDATRDMETANQLLEQCQQETSEADQVNVRNCSQWLGTNRMYQQQWADAQ